MRSMNEAASAKDPGRVKQLAAEHARKYPNGGVLGVEVEGLRVIAACQSGNGSKEAVDNFAKRYPKAPILDRVRSSCRTD